MEKDLKNILARGRVRAICISKERGTEKQAVPEGHFLVDFGIQGDAHAGNWHRQVSLLSYDKVEAFNQRGADVSDGAFGENLVVEGIDFASLPVGTRLCAGTAQLEMTQIGKECHSHCAIYNRMGECIMPREGVFARVIQEGIIRPGDDMTAIAPQEDRPFQAAVITLSDKGARGERKDESGPAAVHLLQEAGYQGGGPERAGHRGGHSRPIHDHYQPGHVKPGRFRYPWKDFNCQSSGQPQSSKGKSGIYIGKPGTWTGSFKGQRNGMRPKLTDGNHSEIAAVQEWLQ